MFCSCAYSACRDVACSRIFAGVSSGAQSHLDPSSSNNVSPEPTNSRVMLLAQVVASEFQQQIPPRIQTALDFVEDEVRQERAVVPDWEIDIEVGN